MKTYLVRGVPASIQQDGWWMDGVEPPGIIRRHKNSHAFWSVPALLTIAILGVCMTIQPQDGTDRKAWAKTPGACEQQSDANDTELDFREGAMLRSLPEIRNWHT